MINDVYWNTFLKKLFLRKNDLPPNKSNKQNLKIQKYLEQVILTFNKPKLIISVTGTNGKSSVCNFLMQLLKPKYKKIAKFSSPHVVCFEERIQINGQNILKEVFFSLYNLHINFIENENLNFFQILFLIAVHYFFENNVDVLILEYGIGARYDCCNVLDNQISIITSIGIDHPRWLGKTKDEVLENKQAIIRPNSILFCNLSDKNLFNKLFKYTTKINTKIINVQNIYKIIKIKKNVIFFSIYDKIYITNVSILFHLENVVVAVVVSLYLNQSVTNKNLKSLTFLPGRCEFINLNDKILLLDGAHNLEATEIFLNFLKTQIIYQGKEIALILGFLEDKDYLGMLANYLKEAEKIKVYVVKMDKLSPRFLSSLTIDRLKKKHHQINILGFDEIIHFLRFSKLKFIVFTGSLLFISYLRAEILNNTW